MSGQSKHVAHDALCSAVDVRVQCLVQGLFDEAAVDGDISQLRRWVVAGQGVAGGGRRWGEDGG